VETLRAGRRQPGSLVENRPDRPTDRPKRSGTEEESFGCDLGALNLNEEEQREGEYGYFFISIFRVIGAIEARPVKSSSSRYSGNTSREFVLGGLFQLRFPSPQPTVRGVIPRSLGSRSRIQGSRYSSACFSLASSPHRHAWCFVDVGH
jgi:hypothetical protein